MALLRPASPLVSPTIREIGASGGQLTLRQPHLDGNVAPDLPEDIPCNVPLVADLIKKRAVPLPELVFRGWKKPAKGWQSWVEEMVPKEKFASVWREAGIIDAILSSRVNVRKSRPMMVALAGFWCPSTCTFVLPWGEVGFTLEDALVLGNLPVWGSPLQRPLTAEEERLRLRLVETKEMLQKVMKRSGKRARVGCSLWLSWFVKLEDDAELLHLGFLAYWLIKFVVPCKPLGEVSPAVFGIAARLSLGERIALAPAVTANLYNDLTSIVRLLQECRDKNARIKIEVWAPFRLLQAWLWERFASLSPGQDNAMKQKTWLRISRWHNRQSHLTYREASDAFNDPDRFIWRPYVDARLCFASPKWYMGMVEKNVVVDEHSPIWVYDILAIVSAAGLVGLATEDVIPMGQYKPYRLSRQLGYDQAVPRSCGQLLIPWDSSSVCPLGVELYIPSTTRKCNVSKGYDEWWKDYCNCYAMILEAKGNSLNQNMTGKRKMNDASDKCICKKPFIGVSLENDGSSVGVKLQNNKDEQEKSCFIAGSTNPSRQPGIIVIDDEAFDLKTTGSEQGEGMKEKSHNHDLRICEGVEESDFDDVLVDELEEFLAHGMRAELFSNVSSSSSLIIKKSQSIDLPCSTYVGDPIREVVKKYPKLFNMIPQHPHYIGLLQSDVDQGTKKIVYTLLWYKLVELMRKTISTTCQTESSEIEQLMKEACSMEKLGFDVRHLIARLRQPNSRLKKLDLAKVALEKARKKLKGVEQQSCSEVSGAQIANLKKAIKVAELNYLEREWDVEILGKLAIDLL